MSIDLDGEDMMSTAELDFGEIVEDEPPVSPLERQLVELENDESIDGAIQRVTICNILYGKTVRTADEIARLCFAYQDENFNHQVEKHVKILKEHSAGRPGARMENNQQQVVVRTKIAVVEARQALAKGDYITGNVRSCAKWNTVPPL